jgi:hypothetical protein
VTEPDERTEFDQAGVPGRRCRLGLETELACSAPQQSHVAHGLSRRQHEQPSRRIGKGLEPAQKALLDLDRQRLGVGKAESACQLARQLEERERVPARLGDHAFAYLVVKPAGPRRIQQRPCVTLPEPSEQQLGEAVELPHLERPAHREHQADRFREEAARNQRK